MMKKLTVPALFVLWANISFAQSMQGPPVMPRDLSSFQNIVNINGQDGFYIRKDLYLQNSYTIIDGVRVLGTPFLFLDWLNGTLTTPDGRKYDYKFKYNVHDQTVSFLNGKDSLEVNEAIKEFTLVVQKADSAITTRYINSSEYQRGKTFYYEVLIDNEKGQLLKTNRKVVTSMGDGIIASKGKQYLKLESSYFYYDKQTKKIREIKNGNIQSVFHLTDDQANDLGLNSYDMNNEEDLLRFAKQYFQKTQLKGF